MDIREIHPNDACSVTMLWNEQILSKWSEELIKNTLGSKDVLAYGVFEQERLLSFCLCQIFYDEMHVLGIATCENSKRKSCAEETLLHCMNKAKQRNINFFTLEVRCNNYAAIALYEKFGFSVVGIRKNYYENNLDALIMSVKEQENDKITE